MILIKNQKANKFLFIFIIILFLISAVYIVWSRARNYELLNKPDDTSPSTQVEILTRVESAQETLEIPESEIDSEPESVEDTGEPDEIVVIETEASVETTAETVRIIEVTPGLKSAIDCWTREDILTVIARCVFCEARGVASQTEQACVIWTVLNRIDSNQYPRHIVDVILSPNQFAYRDNAPTVDDFGRDLIALADDVLCRYERELSGEVDVGRVLPKEYRYFWGNNHHNYFRLVNYGDVYWDYSLPSPYES